MPLPDDAGQHGWVAVWLTAILGALGVAWKSWFAVRRDARDDKRGTVINGGWEGIVKTLREELQAERELRRAAEAEVAALRRRLADVMGQHG